MPAWVCYLCIFIIGACGNYVMAWCCDMEKPCLPTAASLALGILLGLTAAVGYIHGQTDKED